MHSVTLLIPTQNRPTFLERLIKHLAAQKVPPLIIVADSSHQTEAYEANQELISQHDSELSINHNNCRGKHFWTKYIESLETINTDYVCTVADHCFLSVSAVYEAALFLDQNPEYSHANGLIYNLKRVKGHLVVQDYPQYNLEHNDPYVRLTDHFENYTNNFYTLARTQVLKNLAIVDPKNIGRSLKERLATAIPVISGKRKVLGCKFMVRDKAFKKTGFDENGNLMIEGIKEDADYLSQISYGCDDYINQVVALVNTARPMNTGEENALRRVILKQQTQWEEQRSKLRLSGCAINKHAKPRRQSTPIDQLPDDDLLVAVAKWCNSSDANSASLRRR
jgi:glycosyltransferase domain-containing protein